MGVCLAGSPPTSNALNGPGTLNGALHNGSQFSWSTRRRSAKAVCKSPCILLLSGFHSFPSAPEHWGRGSSFQPQHGSCSLSPCASYGRTWMTQGPLHLQWHGLFSAHPTETWEAPGCSFALCDQHCTYTSARARGSHVAVPAVQCACNATQGGSGPQWGPSAHLLCGNVMLQFHTLSAECSLSGDR